MTVQDYTAGNLPLPHLNVMSMMIYNSRVNLSYHFYIAGITSVAVADDQSGNKVLDGLTAIGGTKEFAYCSNRGIL